jgi:hypothetical protein
MNKPPVISSLAAMVATLSAELRAAFDRIYHVSVTLGQTAPPPEMEDWIVKHFGSVDAVRQQRIVKVTNHVILEGTLFNPLRARRPVETPCATASLPNEIDNLGTECQREDCSFCHPLAATPADVFGRVQGRHSLTASNIAKCDGWHAVIIFDEHHPLHFTADQVADYLDVGQRWARTVHQLDPELCYPFFLWNCLWRSGASILHGHAQMVVTKGMHYARVEHWRQAAIRYRQAHGTDYFADLVAVHRALGLAVDDGTAIILPSLTPFKERETYIIAPCLNEDLKSALYRVLNTFVERLKVQSFNVALYQPPLAHTPEDWDGFPFIFRILDRGDLHSPTSDLGSMEFFAQSVVVTDPFHVADALRAGSMEGIP